MNEKTDIKSMQIASFIILSLAMSSSAIAGVCNPESTDLIADAGVGLVGPAPQNPILVEPPVMRYAGPAYFGFTTIDVAPPPQIMQPQSQTLLQQTQDAAKYMQIQNNTLDTNVNTNINTNIKPVAEINTVKAGTNFVNTEYGSVRVIEPSGHYIFK